MDVDVRLIDFDRIYEMIDGLKDIEKDQVIKQGLRDATKLIVDAGKQNLSERNKVVTGNLKYSFRSKLKRSRLGALAGFNSNGSHTHLIDRGTTERHTSKGYNRGKIKGTEFWTDAILSNEGAAMMKVFDGIQKGITKLILRN